MLHDGQLRQDVRAVVRIMTRVLLGIRGVRLVGVQFASPTYTVAF